LLAAKYKSPYTVVESLIDPGALIIADKMLDKKSAKVIKTIPSSDTSVGSRVHDMAQDVVEQIVENIKMDKRFAIQLKLMNRWKFLTKPSYLYTFGILMLRKVLLLMKFSDVNNYQNIQRERIFLKSFVDNFIRLELNLQWEWCVSVSTDGAASMTGKKRSCCPYSRN
jgi:hypothetical protein